MKIATIPRKPKATANGKHKCNIPYKKVGWPENHKNKGYCQQESKACGANIRGHVLRPGWHQKCQMLC